ncbi:MAG TPA: ABC transporter permease [Actinocatenispora sp.]
MGTYLLLEVRRTLRNVPFLLYTVGFPVGFYLLFTQVFGGGQASWAGQYMVSMALYGAMGAGLTGVGARIAVERTKGWTRTLALTPLRPAGYLFVKLVASILLTLPVILLVMLAGFAINGVRLPATTWLALVPLLWLATLPFTALGIAIGYSVRDEVANGVSIVLLFVLSIGGGLWMPVQLFPHWLGEVARGLPSYRAAELSWRVLDGHQPFGVGALVFAGWLVALIAFAGWRFRRAS